MKKILCLLFAMAGFLSCSDDDKPVIPELNKLTKVTCTKNGTAFFSADIAYDQKGQLNRIILNKGAAQYTDNFIIVDNRISVNGTKVEASTVYPSFIHTVYTLDGGKISQKEEMAENEKQGNEVYPATTNLYKYNRQWLSSISQIVQWPKVQGKGYETRRYDDIDRFTWENNNIAYYSNTSLFEMKYLYEGPDRPWNFPFRVLNTFKPVEFDTFSPVNLMFGDLSRDLPSLAFWYNVSDASTLLASYTYQYVKSGDYISGMTIEENIFPVNGAVKENNTYELTFAYNYVVE